jgi:DegV family protein with EDD domain
MTTMSFKKIRFVTDSTCDLPAEWVQKHKISVVPCYVNYNHESYPDDGSVEFRDNFYKLLPTMNPHPTTAAMPPAMAEKAIKDAIDDADHVVLLTVSSKLSGIYNAFRLAASSLPADKYTLIDSLNASMGLGFQVMIGVEVAEATGDVKQVVDAIQRVRNEAHIYVALATIEFLRRSGRVSWAAANIGALLQIKPLLDVHDGEAKPAGRVRTFKRAVDEVKQFVRAQAPLDKMAVLYSTDREEGEQMLEALRDIAPSNTPIIRITPAIGTHLGPGSVAVATISQKWRTQG